MVNYTAGITSYQTFAHATGRLPLPSSESALAAYLVWGIARPQPLDSTTLDNYLAGVAAYHQHFLTLAGSAAQSLRNPAQAPAVRGALASLLKNHKLPSRAKRPLSWRETQGILARGFDLDTAGGLHSRLLWMLCTLGLLRRGAVVALRVSYVWQWLQGSLHLVFLADSDISIRREPATHKEYIHIEVASDKNVDSRKAVYAVIPDHIPALGVFPVEILRHYLHVISPPSLHLRGPGSHPRPPRGALPPGHIQRPVSPQSEDGLLLAWPQFQDPQSTAKTFLRNRYTACSDAFKRLYSRAFPAATKEDLVSIGSHSGRRTMAEFLWACTNHDVRVVADMGHWKILRGAIDKYFSTSLAEQLWVLFHIQDPAKRHVYPALP